MSLMGMLITYYCSVSGQSTFHSHLPSHLSPPVIPRNEFTSNLIEKIGQIRRKYCIVPPPNLQACLCMHPSSLSSLNILQKCPFLSKALFLLVLQSPFSHSHKDFVPTVSFLLSSASITFSPFGSFPLVCILCISQKKKKKIQKQNPP